MRNWMRKLWNDDRGNVLVIACAAFPVVVGSAGLATDTIQWTLWKRQLQRAADSAAIAGVYDRSSAAGATTNTAAAISRDLALNNHNWIALKTNFPEISYPDNDGVKLYQVNVKLAVQQRLPFSSLFLSSPPTISATARAASLPAGGSPCVRSLDTSSSTGITNTGNAEIEMLTCVLHSNSTSANSASATGSAKVKAQAVSAVGGIQTSNNWTVQSYRPYSPPISDPFSGITPDPDEMNCVNSPLNDDTDFSSLPEGTNCFSSLRVNSNKSVTVPANFGPIYINGGGATFQGNFTCVGCTVILTNKTSSSPIGQLTANADANVNITAPTSGYYKGIAIMQDRRAAASNQKNKINGNSGSVITGAIYFPKQELDYNGTGNTEAVCTMFVTYRITFSGNSTTSNKFKDMSQCVGTGLPNDSAIRMVRLVA